MASFEHLEAELELRGPAPQEAVDRTRRRLGAHLAADYLAFASRHNGGEGAIGSLAAIEELELVDEATQNSTRYADAARDPPSRGSPRSPP